ncbi:MAG: hypothetical protein Satyrvirus2_24 [Satyrvirus sp.]|uniref:Uncharacterized protein n=1 Tax=Satyrvirus sp. TaxID=2487771 RepID=A0A3G5AGJ4_9VIRU|nr:MAG: hypothetical protein Satyrvirus2_24 [Satyrvirus sp.]
MFVPPTEFCAIQPACCSNYGKLCLFELRKIMFIPPTEFCAIQPAF